MQAFPRAVAPPYNKFLSGKHERGLKNLGLPFLSSQFWFGGLFCTF